MKTWYGILLLSLLPFLLINAEEKNVKKNFKVNPNQRVFINGVPEIGIKIIGWDKNEANVNINVKANSSDADFKLAYLQNFDVTYKYEGNDVIIDLIETPKKGSWNFFDIFKGNFSYSFKKEITGEIYLPREVLLIGNFKYSNISVSSIYGELVLKGKGNHFDVKDCAKVNEIINEIGDVIISGSGGKLNAELTLSPITIRDYEGSVKIKSYNAAVNISRLTGYLNLNAYYTRGTIEEVSKGAFLYSETSDLTFKKIGGILEIIDKTGILNLYEIDGFKLEGNKTDLTADRITAKAKAQVFLTTKEGKYRISNSTGSFFIDDDYSSYSFTNSTGNINYSASNSSFTGRDIKGDWKSDTKYSTISLSEITAYYIEAFGKGRKFKAIIANNPRKVELKNTDADVELTLNKEIRTSLFLTSQGGSLHSDFSIDKYREGSKQKAAERINGGGAVVSVETYSGDIVIKKR